MKHLKTKEKTELKKDFGVWSDTYEIVFTNDRKLSNDELTNIGKFISMVCFTELKHSVDVIQEKYNNDDDYTVTIKIEDLPVLDCEIKSIINCLKNYNERVIKREVLKQKDKKTQTEIINGENGRVYYADMLNVSKPDLVKLLEAKKIPYTITIIQEYNEIEYLIEKFLIKKK